MSYWNPCWLVATIQSYMFDLELIQFNTSGFSPDYHSFVTTYSMLTGNHSFDDLHSNLVFYDQRLTFQFSRDTTVHQALVSTRGTGGPSSGGNSKNQSSNNNASGKNNGNRWNWNNKHGGRKGVIRTTPAPTIVNQIQPLRACLLVLHLVIQMFHRYSCLVLPLWILTLSLQALTNHKGY